MKRPRQHVAAWILDERVRYADVKFDRQGGNHEVIRNGMDEGRWDDVLSFMQNYVKRAELAGLDTLQGRQALAKAVVTGLDFLEIAVDKFGPMPKPGRNSGVIEEWDV